jgi:hypothetical protein
VTAASGAPKSKARWFAIALILMPILVVAGAVGIARTNWFMAQTMDPWIQNADRNFYLTGQNCAVLVFGDSTAFTGVYPDAITAATGKTACNISQTVGSVGVNGTFALDAFLENNPRPQTIVFVFAPENFHHSFSWSHLKYAEGVLQLVRHQSATQIVSTLISHPGQALGFAAWVYENTVREWLHRPYYSRQLFAGMMDLRHTAPLNKPPQVSCNQLSQGHTEPDDDPVPGVDAAWIQSLRQRYASRAGHVIVLVSPLPDCDVRAGVYRGQLAGLTDNRLETYPIGLYNDRNRHFTRDGGQRFSAEIAQQLRAMEAVPAQQGQQ